ncbi:hypothetical protein [Thermomonospora echinospora]|nr:hypothetical protein [Thermomonospora echinospora]
MSRSLVPAGSARKRGNGSTEAHERRDAKPAKPPDPADKADVSR